MKYLIFLLIPFCSLNAQNEVLTNNFPMQDGNIIYQNVVEVESGKKDLYLNTKSWAIKTFADGSEVIQSDDEDQIVIKGYVENGGHNMVIQNPKNWFTLTIDFKENKFRYTLTDVRYDFDVTVFDSTFNTNEPFEDWVNENAPKMSKGKTKKLDKFCLELHSRLNILAAGLKNELSKKVVSDW